MKSIKILVLAGIVHRLVKDSLRWLAIPLAPFQIAYDGYMVAWHELVGLQEAVEIQQRIVREQYVEKELEHSIEYFPRLTKKVR